MLFWTLFFELRLVARTRFGHAILSLSLSLSLHIHSHGQHTVARTGSNWPSFLSLKYLCKFSFVHNLFNLSSHSLTHTCTLSVSGNRKKSQQKYWKIIARRSHIHKHTQAHSHSQAQSQSHIQRLLPASFWVWRSPHDGDDETTTWTTRTHVNAADNTRLSQPFRTRAQNKLKAQAKTTKQMQRSQLGWQKQSRAELTATIVVSELRANSTLLM